MDGWGLIIAIEEDIKGGYRDLKEFMGCGVNFIKIYCL